MDNVDLSEIDRQISIHPVLSKVAFNEWNISSDELCIKRGYNYAKTIEFSIIHWWMRRPKPFLFSVKFWTRRNKSILENCFTAQSNKIDIAAMFSDCIEQYKVHKESAIKRYQQDLEMIERFEKGLL